jgi:hypothetical protein
MICAISFDDVQLIPEQRENLIEMLEEDGATSPCLIKPVDTAEVIRYSSDAATRAGIR